MIVYFDNAATTKVCEAAIDAMNSVMQEMYGNPSSMHRMGRQASALIETARKSIADTMSANPKNIYFTSGGTEANNWAVLGLAELQSRKGRHIITSATEHDSVMQPIKKLESIGWEVTYLMPDSMGRLPFEAFAKALREDTAFASIMLVNNEVGSINTISEYASEIKRRNYSTLLHTDAVSAFCKIPMTIKTLSADLISISAHKLHGPKGVGALYIKDGLNQPAALLGGSQENGRRPGTEALPAIVGFGQAVIYWQNDYSATHDHIKKLHTYAVSSLGKMLPEAVFISQGDCPYLLSLSLPGHKSEVLMSFLDSEGICVSKSSACKKGARSRVLEAMRLNNEIIDGAIRISFSRYNTFDEVDCLVTALKRASKTLLK